jgi:hypothetical protein
VVVARDPSHGYNAAIFDASIIRRLHSGIHEVLRRQGLLAGTCVRPEEQLSPGQVEQISRASRLPRADDDAFVAEHRRWMA